MAQGFVGARLNPDIEEHAQAIDFIEELPRGYRSEFIRQVILLAASGKIDVTHILENIRLSIGDTVEKIDRGGGRDVD